VVIARQITPLAQLRNVQINDSGIAPTSHAHNADEKAREKAAKKCPTQEGGPLYTSFLAI